MLKEGFYTALGTPLTKEGTVITESMEKQIEDQIAAGASGLFIFGTMGMGGCVKDSEYQKVIRAAADIVKGRCTLLAGASENSIARAAYKIEICNKENIDGIVLTPPYYFTTDEAGLLNFFKKAASMTHKDLYLYDHEPITKHKLTYNMVRMLSRITNVKGIKSFDAVLIKSLTEQLEKEDFTAVFSGSDLFDMAYMYGIKRYMDGIFACMPKSISNVQKCFNRGNFEEAKGLLNQMMQMRDDMISFGIWQSFSHAMNLLGYEGCFAPDYEPDISDEAKDAVKNGLIKLGEI